MASTAGGAFGFASGLIIQEFGYDDDVDETLRQAVEAETGTTLVDEDYEDVADSAIVWWRDDDGDVDDLTDLLVDAQANLDHGGHARDLRRLDGAALERNQGLQSRALTRSETEAPPRSHGRRPGAIGGLHRVAVESPRRAVCVPMSVCGPLKSGGRVPGTSAPGPVAQLVEQRVYTASVVGSSPAGSTTSSVYEPLTRSAQPSNWRGRS